MKQTGSWNGAKELGVSKVALKEEAKELPGVLEGHGSSPDPMCCIFVGPFCQGETLPTAATATMASMQPLAFLRRSFFAPRRVLGSYPRCPVATAFFVFLLGPPVVPFYPFLGEGSPTKIDYRKKGTLILTSLLEDLVWESVAGQLAGCHSQDAKLETLDRAHYSCNGILGVRQDAFSMLQVCVQ